MGTDGHTAMPTDDLLTLNQWFSPAFPVGAFSYSHGLEALVQAGRIDGDVALLAWVQDVLTDGAGRNDVILIAAAYEAGDTQALLEIDATARAFAPSQERLLEMRDQGESFCRTINAVWGTSLPPLSYPVAVGAAARACDLPLGATAQLYLHALVSSLVSAGIRLIPIGQTQGQSCVRALAPLCKRVSAEAQHQALDALGASAFVTDIASMRHEVQYSRMFRS